MTSGGAPDDFNAAPASGAADGADPPPRRGRSLRGRLVLAVLALLPLVGLVVLLAWLLGTQAGLDRVLALVREVGPVRIEATGARGRLLGPLAIERLAIEHERVEIRADGVRVDLAPSELLMLVIGIDAVEIDAVDVRVMPRTKPPPDRPLRFLPGPLRLDVDRFAIGRATIHAPTGATVPLDDVRGALRMSRSTLEVVDGHADGGAWAVEADAELRAADPLGLAGEARWRLRAGEREYSGSAGFDGDLEALRVQATTVAPRGLAFDGRLKLVDGFAFEGRAAFDRFDPAALGAGTFFGTVTGALDVRGEIDAFTGAGNLQATALPVGPLDVRFEGGWTPGTFAVRRLEVATARGDLHATASGAVDVDVDGPRIRFAGDWRGLRWPLSGRPVVTLPQGRYSIAGQGRYDFTVAAGVRGPALPPLEVDARGTLDADRLRVAALDARALRGRITGSGDLSWRGTRPWSATLQGRGLDFGVLRPALAGRVNLALAANGRGFAPTGHWDARIARLDGTVRRLPARGRGSASMRAGELRVDGLDVAFGSAQLQADGVVGRRTSDLEWRLRVDDLGSFVPDAAGSVRSRGAIAGQGGQRSVQGTIGARALRWGEVSAAQVIADVDVDAADVERSYLKVAVTDVGVGERRADQVRLTLDGRASDHKLVLRATRGADWIELVSRGSYEPDARIWTVQLDDFRVNGPPLLSYRLESPSTLEVREDGLRLGITCFVRDGERICAAGSWYASSPWALAVDATDLPLRMLPLELPRGTDYGGSAFASAALRGAPGEPWTAEGTIGFEDAEFRYRAPSGRPETVRLGTGRIDVRAAPDAYGATVGLATVGGSTLAGVARVERDERPLSEAPLTGRFALDTRELAWLPLFMPEVDRFAGRLESQVELGGTAGDPLLEGYVEFSGGEVDIFRTNLLLRDVNARVTLAGSRIGFEGRAATKGGTATASGALEWRERQPYGTLTFAGENLLVADLPEARVTASPALEFRVAGRRIDVSGEIRVPTARLEPKDLRGAVLPSGDEIIVGAGADPAERAPPFEVNVAVRLVLGDDVRVDAYGLTGRLGGSLMVNQRPNELPFGTGELVIREGRYEAFTRELDIERGRLLFAGQTVSNPGLDIRAQRKIIDSRTGREIVAGINVRGTLLRPQISFYSDPPMSQSQIASMIIVGRTLDDIQDSTAGELAASDARAALTAQGGALLAGQLGRYVGIDDVAVEQGANNATSLVFGKFLSPRLYVSYGVSLTEAINTLKLRYTIGDRWVIRVESGARQSADIEYTIERP